MNHKPLKSLNSIFGRALSEEQARTLINLEQRYKVWMEAERALMRLPYGMHRKTIGDHAYLYETRDRRGNGRSLGPWLAEQEQRLAEYQARKAKAQYRQRESKAKLNESGTVARALRLPLLASEAGPILREADRRELLGNQLLVVGTNAMAAYAIEAGGVLRDAPMETEDCDLAWAGIDPQESEQMVWNMLKAVDATFTINTERTFQARNAKAYEVEILVAPSRAAAMARTDRPRLAPLPEQEWLLHGRPVDRVVARRDGSPARIVAPDPRWFALVRAAETLAGGKAAARCAQTAQGPATRHPAASRHCRANSLGISPAGIPLDRSGKRRHGKRRPDRRQYPRTSSRSPARRPRPLRSVRERPASPRSTTRRVCSISPALWSADWKWRDD